MAPTRSTFSYTRSMRFLPALLVAFVACSPGPLETAPTSAPTAVPSPEPTVAPTPDPPEGPFAAARRWEAADPDELTQRLLEAERGLRSDDPGDPERLGRLQQAAYRQLAATPEWREPVLGSLPGDLRPAADANLGAHLELRELTTPREALPDDWRIVPPPPANELRGHYDAAEAEFGVDWEILAAIHLVETRMGRIRGDSVAGARGPMQFLPETWEHYGEGDITDPRDAVRAAARYLDAHGVHEDLDGALYAYNRSGHYVRAIRGYAGQMDADPRLYLGYYHWQVYYGTTQGDALLEVGWEG